MNYIIKLHQKLTKYPFGKQLFSKAVANKAPYFNSIKPTVEELKPNYIAVSIKKRRAVQNHIKTVHAIAMCNLSEFAAGICMEASIPKHLRWIPRGMNVRYLKKAQTDLVGICDLGKLDWDNLNHVICHVSVKDKNGVEVMIADIDMKVSPK